MARFKVSSLNFDIKIFTIYKENPDIHQILLLSIMDDNFNLTEPW